MPPLRAHREDVEVSLERYGWRQHRAWALVLASVLVLAIWLALAL